MRALESAIEERHDRTTAKGVQGQRIRAGVASGRLVTSPIADPYVLLVRDDKPETLRAALGARAIVVEQGRKHPFAAIFAKLGRPVVALGRKASALLAPDSEVTVDATRGVVANGTFGPLLRPLASDVASVSSRLQTALGVACTAEVSSPAMIDEARVLGARSLRIDTDALLLRQPTLDFLRAYLVASDPRERTKRLEQVLVNVRADVEGLLERAHDLGTTLVLGNRTPRSFFPHDSAGLAAVAKSLGMPVARLTQRLAEVGADNSKLGLRGARWILREASLHDTLATAVFEAWSTVGVGPLRLLTPAIAFPGEMQQVKTAFEAARKRVERDLERPIDVAYGAGIETAAGALAAAEISKHVTFFEYDTQGLTENTHGLSPDDASPFLQQMIEAGAYVYDPFEVLDMEGVGKLIAVSQYIAGGIENAFPAAIRGPQLLHTSAAALGIRTGIRELVASPRTLLDVLATRADAAAIADNTPAPDTVLGLLAARAEAVTALNDTPSEEAPQQLLKRIVREVRAGLLSKRQALLAVPISAIDALQQPAFEVQQRNSALALGIGAAPGCAVGQLALSVSTAEKMQQSGVPYVMAVTEVHAVDIESVRKAAGVISIRGSKTSHAAIVASNSGVASVVCESVAVDPASSKVWIGRTKLGEGDWVSIDGSSGMIFNGQLERVTPSHSSEFATLMAWADEVAHIKVHANADTPLEVRDAFAAGAEAIGLVRTEHMLFEPRRLAAFCKVILGAGDSDAALTELEAMQREDFQGMFEAAGARSVALRLLDPPLSEFLPKTRDEARQLGSAISMSAEAVSRRVVSLWEIDSLLGLRGARLSLARPEIERMQVRAMAQAYAAVITKGGMPASLKITVPMVNTGAEMKAAARRIRAVVREIANQQSVAIPLLIGAMVETPKAALDASGIAEHCDYFSYGT
ncbi:MAG: hypothetical protein H7Z43_05500, partial [Clostridia bacterium]|nr:hypothetical protein [Deltaproteobacteria bacterium]